MALSRFITVFLLMLLLFAWHSSIGQFSKEKQNLEKEKQANLARIAEASKILEETRSSKKVTVGQLNAINQKIRSHKRLIILYNREVALLQENMSEITILLESLEADLDALKKEYAQMVYNTYKIGDLDKMLFLISASTFNEFLLRLNYMKQYSKKRREQMQLIDEVKQQLSGQRVVLRKRRSEKQDILEKQITENQKLIGLYDKQQELVADLSQREAELKRELESRQQADKKMEQTIAQLIEKERKRRLAMQNPEIEATNAIDAAFRKNRRRLEWPVNSGFITGKFGKQPHPVLRGIYVDNLGVDIQTNRNETVMSVFNGEVMSIASMPGSKGKVVFVKHGDYYTVYGNLKDLLIQTGDQIMANQALGKVATDKTGTSVLQFQIWQNNQKLNPERWLRGKN